MQKHATSVRFDLFIWRHLYSLTYSSVENGQSAIRETHQYTPFHMPVGQTRTFKKTTCCIYIKKEEDPSLISLYLHYAEHSILQLYRMEALLPLSHRWVHIHTRITNSIIRFLEFWPYTYSKWNGHSTLTIRSVLRATWWAERCSFSEPLPSSGPAPLLWGLNSHHLLLGHSPWSSETHKRVNKSQSDVTILSQ